MKAPTINKVKQLVKEAGATSGILILFDEPTANYASASYGINRDQCKITGEALDAITNKLETSEIELW